MVKGTTKFEQEALYKTPAEIKAAIDHMEKQLPQQSATDAESSCFCQMLLREQLALGTPKRHCADAAAGTAGLVTSDRK